MSARIVQGRSLGTRGYACVGLNHPKSAANVGAVMRAAAVYGVERREMDGAVRQAARESGLSAVKIRAALKGRTAAEPVVG